MAAATWTFDGHPRKFREIISRRKKKKGVFVTGCYNSAPNSVVTEGRGEGGGVCVLNACCVWLVVRKADGASTRQTATQPARHSMHPPTHATPAPLTLHIKP
jgi:hypothetical protein